MKLSLTQAVTLAFMLGGTGQAAANMHRAKAFSTLERRQAPQTSAPTYKVEDCGTVSAFPHRNLTMTFDTG